MIEKTQFVNIVGEDRIYDTDSVIDEYSRDMSFANPVKPALVVKPENAEQITDIVNLAKDAKTPLIPISSGPPHFRGDTVPCAEGAIIVDLSEMKNIINTNRRNRVVMFEPGVTFGELSAAVAKEGMRLNMPLLPRQSKSVVGSMLEREPVIMPKYHWDISDPLACTEIIFGTGDMFRTGSAAGSGTIEEQWAAGGVQKEAAGPSSVSWYRLIQGAQGGMGIVTWASARCELTPSLERPYFIVASELEKVLEAVHWLVRLRLINECVILNSTNFALMNAAPDSSEYDALKQKLPEWILFYNIAAYEFLTEERMDGQIEDMIELAQRLGVEPITDVAGVSADAFLKLTQKPSEEPYWKLRQKGGCEDVLFLSIYDKLPDIIDTMKSSAETAGYPADALGIYLQPIVQGSNCHCEFNLFYNPGDSREVKIVSELSASVVDKLISKDAFFSRPYGASARKIIERDPATREALKKVKNIVDPLDIMNPGKIFI
jgi:FAD/FMN-containing dehydrogenase